ncbi:UPF0051 protein ABCI8, chloroplastic [Glycine soja]|nr:UPF0051 protein ABCI8, chloroplastic [Glycine soja]
MPNSDNYFVTLNSAVFNNGMFCYVPKDTRCPMKLMNYFRTNSWDTGQFDHTLVVADDKSSMEYYESCTTTSHNVNPLHAAMVEMYYCEEGAEIKYSTMQNCYPWDGSGKGKCTTL